MFRHGRRLLFVALATFAVVGVAFAYWTASGTGTASATAGTLNAPTAVIASATPGSSTVGVSWTASTGLSPAGYYVIRTRTSDSTTAAACGSSPSSLITGTSCNDATVPDGTYTYTVVAKLATWTTTSAASNSVTVASAVLDHFSVTPASTTQTSGSPFSVTVVARDASNNVLTNYAGTIHFTTTDPSGSVVVPANYAFVSGDNGSHTFTNAVTLQTAGSQTVSVNDTVQTTKTGTSAAITVVHGAAFRVVLTGGNGVSLASGITRQLTGTIQDQAGNTVTTGLDATRSVTFGKTAGTGTVSGLGSSTAVAGVATLTVTGAAAGSITLQASAPLTAGSTPSNPITFTVTEGAATQILLTGTTTDLTSGTGRVLTATIQDFGGNTVTTGADSTVVVNFSQTAGTGSLTGLGTASASGGVATKTVTGSSAGSITVRAGATLAGPGATNSGTLSFNVVHGAATQIALTGLTTDLASGSTRTITATIQDAAGNTVTTGADASRSVTFSQPSGTGSVSGLGSSTASAGVATLVVTGNLSGPVTLRGAATLTAGATNSSTLSFSVVNGTATQITLSGVITDLASGTGRTFTATLKDAAGNTASTGTDATRSVTFAQTTGTGTVTGLGAATASGGVATLTVTGGVIGSVTLRASATLTAGATNSNTLSFNVVHGAATQITLSGATTNLATGVARALTATIKDAAGNTVTTGADASRSVTFAKTAGAGTVSGLGSATAGAGVATLSVTGTGGGSITLQASATLTAGATSSNTLTFTIDPLTILSVNRMGGNRKYSFTGSNANPAGGTVTVTICTVNTLPCSVGNTAGTATATPAADGTWLTAADNNNLGDDVRYYAQAAQSTILSSAFAFISTVTTPAVTATSGIVMANGGASTIGTVSAGDTLTITYGGPLLASSFCSTWTQVGTQTSPASVTVIQNGAADQLGNLTVSGCSFNLGTVNLAQDYVVGSITYASSSVSYDTFLGVLTITLGGGSAGTAGRTAQTPTYAASTAITDQSGVALAAGTPTTWTGTSSRF
jgi:hypothetical protein